MIVVIDGRVINSEKLLHKKLQKDFKFPAYYGANFDALWDMLTGWIEYPVFLVLKNYEPLMDSMGNKFLVLKKVLDEAELEINGFNYILLPTNTIGSIENL